MFPHAVVHLCLTLGDTGGIRTCWTCTFAPKMNSLVVARQQVISLRMVLRTHKICFHSLRNTPVLRLL